MAVASSPPPDVPEPPPPAPLVDFASVPPHILKKLLADKSIRDGKEDSIAFGTDAYADKGSGHDAHSPITAAFLCRKPYAVRARVEKSREAQSERTKRRAEVFTPSWLCKRMVDFLDGEILAAKNKKKGRAACPHAAAWREYVDVRVLEITCGEAPFIVSRYDAATGAQIPVKDRIGVLDRKLRMVNENAADEAEWMKWAVYAYESVYGYEYQGDSLAVARYNLLTTFEDNLRERWGRRAMDHELVEIARRIAWNFWQIDGLTGTAVGRDAPVAPCLPGFEDGISTQWRRGAENAEAGGTGVLPVQGELFSATESTKSFGRVESGESVEAGGRVSSRAVSPARECFIFDWRARKPVKYNDIGGRVVLAAKDAKSLDRAETGGRVSSRAVKSKGAMTMKFDYAIGNPPYQEETGGTCTSDRPIYNLFMDESYKVADKVELITPARFLFNAGATPKAWNRKMLDDPHFKVLEYMQKSDTVFANTDIKGGVAVTYRDATSEFGSIGTFISFPELNSILKKVETMSDASLADIISNRGLYRFSPKSLRRTSRRVEKGLFTIIQKPYLQRIHV